MLGAIIGDIAGSRFECINCKSTDFTLFSATCDFTDDSVMSLAVCDALLKAGDDIRLLRGQAAVSMQQLGREYIHVGYGWNFKRWLLSDDPQPYNSFGNGAAMRVSGCGYAAQSIEQCKAMSEAVTAVSHDHPLGLQGAEAVAVAVYMARTGSSMEDIRNTIERDYYSLDFTLDEIREGYSFDVSCQGSVPQALEAFFESSDFESTIRLAISIGGDSDTIAAIAGSVAEAYYGIPAALRDKAMSYMDARLLGILDAFEQKYPPKIV